MTKGIIKVQYNKVKNTVKLEVSCEAFAQVQGYASMAELLEAHGSVENAIDYWKDKWQSMGLQVNIA